MPQRRSLRRRSPRSDHERRRSAALPRAGCRLSAGRRSDVQWATLLAAALVLLGLLLVAAAPIAHVFLHPGSVRFFASLHSQVEPKGPETVRYLLAVLAALVVPLLLSREAETVPPVLSRHPGAIRA